MSTAIQPHSLQAPATRPAPAPATPSLVVRPAALAGRFYPSDPQALADTLDQWLGLFTPTVADRLRCPKMLVVPHAGHAYSGAMAARAYALLKPHVHRIRRIVLMGPAHRAPAAGLAWPGCDAFETPLGVVKLDPLAAMALNGLPGMQNLPQAHAQEHCLEVQLPFLQRVWAGQPELPPVLPLLVGALPTESVMPVFERLWGGAETLFVITTDLSHYRAYEEARRIDHDTCDRIMAMDSGLHGQQACGARVLNPALACAQQRGMSIQALGQCNSGDTFDVTEAGRERVVGYASFALFDDHAAHNKTQQSANDADQTPEGEAADQAPVLISPALERLLLWMARMGLAKATGLVHQEPPPLEGLSEADRAQLSSPGASFVTLTEAGRLRGCIGSLKAVRNLGDDVMLNASSAAIRDQRFAPVPAELVPQLGLEVSVLTEPEPLTFANQAHALWQLQPEVHGVIFQAVHEGRVHRSTFLPQVWAQFKHPVLFMAQLKRKAGLTPNYWSDSVSLWVYRVQKFKAAPPATN